MARTNYKRQISDLNSALNMLKIDLNTCLQRLDTQAQAQTQVQTQVQMQTQAQAVDNTWQANAMLEIKQDIQALQQGMHNMSRSGKAEVVHLFDDTSIDTLRDDGDYSLPCLTGCVEGQQPVFLTVKHFNKGNDKRVVQYAIATQDNTLHIRSFTNGNWSEWASQGGQHGTTHQP